MAALLLPQQTDIVRDEQRIVRRISHARSPYQPTGFVPASPTTLADWYLRTVGDLYGVHPGWLTAQTESEDDADNAIEAYRLVLSDVRTVRDKIVVSYGQAYARLPVFEAGLTVRVRSDLSAVISSQSTLHLDIEIGIVLRPVWRASRLADRADRVGGRCR